MLLHLLGVAEEMAEGTFVCITDVGPFALAKGARALRNEALPKAQRPLPTEAEGDIILL